MQSKGTALLLSPPTALAVGRRCRNGSGQCVHANPPAEVKLLQLSGTQTRGGPSQTPAPTDISMGWHRSGGSASWGP